MAFALLFSIFIGIFSYREQDVSGATTVGTIKVTSGGSRNVKGANYLLDGDIEVTGDGSTLVIENSTITLSQDVGLDGVIGGGDDHIYHIFVKDGGTMMIKNSTFTTETGQLHPYFAINITIEGESTSGDPSLFYMYNSVLEGPGNLTVTDSAKLEIRDSVTKKLESTDNLAYDIDGDGETDDDEDYNDDGIILTVESGASSLIIDSELKDSFSLESIYDNDTAAGNIIVSGTDSNLTAINSFLDIDFETNSSRGTHNMLKVTGGAQAHLIGVTMNDSAQSAYPAILVDGSSKAVYYRWIAAHVTDSLGIDATGLDLDIMKVEGSSNKAINSDYLDGMEDVLDYMGKTELTWARTDIDGWAILPVITDVLTEDSMPNSDATPDYLVKASLGGESINKSAKFKSYPNIAPMGEESNLIRSIKSGSDVDSRIVSQMGGSFTFRYQVVDPDSTSFFSDLSVDLTVSDQVNIKGSSAVVNGIVYPSYYSFDGHLLVERGGKLVINDTVVMFQTDDGPAYIMVDDGGEVVLNNVTLGELGSEGLYVYVLGSEESKFNLNGGNFTAEELVVKEGANSTIETKEFRSSVTVIGSGSSLSIGSNESKIDSLIGKGSTIGLSGGNFDLETLDIPGVRLHSQSATFDHYLDLSGDSHLIDVNFNGTLPSGREKWVSARGNAEVRISWLASANVIDSGGNPISGAEVSISRIAGGTQEDVGSVITGKDSTAVFQLLERKVTESGSNYMGNYRLKASYMGYESKSKLASLNGSGIDLTITIPGGPNVVPNFLNVNGPLIDGQLVEIIGNLSNVGIFDANGFDVQLLVNGELENETHIDGLKTGESREVKFYWQCQQGDVNFTLLLDPEDDVSEVGEDDNLLSSLNVIGIGPDYSIDVFSPTETWVFGIPGTISMEITNDGESDPAENNFTVDLMWQTEDDRGIISEDILVDYVPPMEGATKTVEWSPTVTGEITIVAEIDAKFDRSPVNSWDSMTFDVKTLPDLVVKDGSFNVDVVLPVTINTEAGISFVVENKGELPSEDFSVALYDGVVDEKNKVDVDRRVPSLQPGQEVTVNFQWMATSPVGEHDLIASIDVYDDVIEQDENNSWTFQVRVDTEPDIYFKTDIGTNPRVVTEGMNTTIWVHVANKGNTMARDVEIRFSMDSDTNMIGSEVLNLLPGQSKNTSIKWSSSQPGAHTILVFADPDEKIAETDRDNNFKSTDLQVLGRPDITMRINDMQISPEGPIPIGTRVYLNATIWNKGETDAENVIVRFYDGDPSSGGKIIQWKENNPSVTIDELGAGSYRRVNLQWTATGGGEHEIFAVMDLSDIIDESNEENNKRSWSAYVMTLPDLSFEDLAFYQGGFRVQSSGVDKERDPEDMIKLRINATLVNSGDMPVPEFSVKFYNGNPIQDENAPEIGELRYPEGTLGGNDEMEVGIDWNVDYPKGIRDIYLTATLMEGKEQTLDNNDISSTLEVFDIDDVPEIEIDTNSVSVFSKYSGIDPLSLTTEQRNRIAYNGMNLSISFNITNKGGVPATNVTVHLVAENESGKYIEFTQNIPLLAEDETQLINGHWNIDDRNQTNISIIIDPTNKVREFDEGNNQLVYSVNVKEAPDLTAELLESGDAYNPEEGRFDMTVGEQYTISYRIINTGNITYSGLDVSFNGPALDPVKTISIDPYGEKIINFVVKPETPYDTVVSWRCSVNEEGNFYESDMENNDALGSFMVNEKEEKSFPWLLLTIILFLVILIVGGTSYFLINRFQKADMAKCSNCGGLVEMDSTLCPHCGIEFSDELECECGEVIPPGATECPNCGKPVETPLPSEEEEEEFEEITEEEGEEEEKEIEEEKETSEEEVRPSEDMEPQIEEAEEISEDELEIASDVDEEEMAECFECGAVIPISAPICPHCGAVFE